MPSPQRLVRPRRRLLAALALLAVTGLAACSAVPSSPSGTGASSGPGSQPRTGTTAPSSAAPAPLLDESFSGNTLNTEVWNTCHWWAERGCTIGSGQEMQWYLPDQVEVAGGTLRLTAKEGPHTGSDGVEYAYESGMVTTGPPKHDADAKLAFTYGTVDVRFRSPEGRGLWPAIWLLPASEQSRPEIDMLEIIGQDPGELIMHLHPEDRSADSPSKRYRLPGGATMADGWHDLRMEWTDQKIVIFLDGKQVWRVTGGQIPDEPMYLVMNLAVGGAYPGPPDSSTDFPKTFEIDRVRITSENPS